MTVEPNPAARHAPGDLLDGRFRIERWLGAGGMGEVYIARQLGLDRPVAIKTLLPQYASDPDARARFLREARVASSLRHPNVVEIYDVAESEGVPFLAMELLRGVTLHEMVGQGQALEVGDALVVTHQLLDALIAAHEIGLVHRDLKPENVFVEDTAGGGQRIVVVDFGLAFIEGGGDMRGRMTREGLVVGTPAYLSPEQAQGHPVGPPSDVYALGVLLFEMLTGDLPFAGSEINILTQHIYVKPPRPGEVTNGEGIPRELEDLVLDMLAKSPEARPTVRTIRDRLRVIEGTMAGQRQRGRDDSYLLGREARMVSLPARTAVQRPPGASTGAVNADLRVGVHGDLSRDLWYGLPVNGIEAVRLDSDEAAGQPVDLVLCTTGRPEDVAILVGRGQPVVSVAPRNDIDILARLLRAGATEVIPAPLAIDETVRKLRKAQRKARRSSGT